MKKPDDTDDEEKLFLRYYFGSWIGVDAATATPYKSIYVKSGCTHPYIEDEKDCNICNPREDE